MRRRMLEIIFLVPPPPAPLTSEDRLPLARLLALGAWRELPDTLRRGARFDVRIVGDALRLLVDEDAVQSFAGIPGETCLEPGRINAVLLDLLQLAGSSSLARR
jgi:hypothetical protein